MNRDLIAKLEALSAIPDAEIRSRRSAAGEIKQGLNAAIVALHAAAAVKQSSPEMSSLAGRILAMTAEETNDPDLLASAQSLAGCVLSQDETPGQVEAPEDDPQTAINRNLAAAQLEGQAKPITETVAIRPEPSGPPGATALNREDLENGAMRDEGDAL